MSLKQKLQEDLKSSMKNKDNTKKSVVTLIRASIKQFEVDNRVELDDSQVIDIIAKLLKQTKDSLNEFKDMKQIMSSIMPKVKGRADGKLINELVRKNLQ